MKTLLFMLFLVASASAQGQISFTYDASGNRTAGNITITKASADGQEPFFDDAFGVEKASISIAPNPTKGMLKISVPDITQKPVLQVYTIGGKLVAKIPVTSNYQDLNISSYPNGIYLFHIINGTERDTWKIIKE